MTYAESPWTAFPPGALPCMVCGVSVAPVRPERIEVVETRADPESGWMVDIPATRCDSCWWVRHSALDSLSAHPALRQALGSAEHALYLLEAALDGLEVIEVTDPHTIDRYTASALTLRRLINELALPGAMCQWIRRARGGRGGLALGTRPNRDRWDHVSDDLRASLTRGHVALFRDSLGKPKRVGLTDNRGRPSGCMLCGVAEVETLPSEVDSAWVGMSADSATIGGRPRVDAIEGAVCPVCGAAIDWAGGVGPTAMERSVLVHLRAVGVMGIEGVDGLRAWAVIPGLHPNAEPWQHVDLSPVREYLAKVDAPVSAARR